MKTKNKFLILLFISVLSSCSEKKTIKPIKNQLTAINPLTYTGVVYAGLKDSAFVSTYSGRIALRINGLSNEILITEVNDEIYDLVYFKNRKEIIAATKNKGVLVINSTTGKTINNLKFTSKLWALNLFFSDDKKELYAFDMKGINYIWDVNNEYKIKQLPDNFPDNYLRATKKDILFFSGKNNTISLWSKEKNKIIKERKLKGNIIDIDNKHNILLIDDNKFIKYSFKNDSILYSKTHPSYIRILKRGDTIKDTYMKLKLTAGRFINNKILTAGVDRSIRIWDSKSGTLLNDLIGHSASITAIDISSNIKQFVSVDAKGGIKFWSLNNINNNQ